ncbi:MAG TPA: hypothetical protein VND93_08280 [Myxococcales bacterium]|nr:hypothetical protein [Myxococcales bacterium]
MTAALLSTAAFAQAGVKGAMWLRLDGAYNTYPVGDARRVAWNLDYADNIPFVMWTGQPLASYVSTLNSSYGVKTLMRLGDSAVPSAADKSALEAATFSCSSINGFMSALDGEASQADAALGAAGAFILGNEVNYEWGLSGKAYGRAYSCYLAHWNGTAKANYALLASGPGACILGGCPAFYDAFFTAVGAGAVDGFAIHAYGQTPSSFQSDFTWQVDRINTSRSGSPVYITEYNPGASYGNPLPVEPDATYFDGCHSAVATYNSTHGNQIKALLYFVDQPDNVWTRFASQCSPPQAGGWWPTSLCQSSTRYSAWFNSGTGTPPPSGDGVSLAWTKQLPPFVMPGQISRVKVTATNTGGTTWSGSGNANWYRLGPNSNNQLTYTAFPQCGGFTNSVTDSRVYTCGTVSPGGTNVYSFDVRAPWNTTSAKITAKEVHDGVAWFGTAINQTVGVGQSGCGTALTQCILFNRPDILTNYASWGWNTACWNRDSIVNNWCGLDPTGCNGLKAGACAAFNNGTRCTQGLQVDGTPIDANGTFEGFTVCGTNHQQWKCLAASAPGWTATGLGCN